jgi:hypothetical protein
MKDKTLNIEVGDLIVSVPQNSNSSFKNQNFIEITFVTKVCKNYVEGYFINSKGTVRPRMDVYGLTTDNSWIRTIQKP